MDNYSQFCKFFEVNNEESQGFSAEYEHLLSGFKTLFPKYVLRNDSVAHSIIEATDTSADEVKE